MTGPDAAQMARQAHERALIESAFLAGCAAFEGKSPWASPHDLLQQYLESLEESA
jgi:hypothetical protein